MATVQTNDIRVQNARNLIDCLTSNPSYTFIGKPTAWENESSPPVPDNSIKEFYKVHDDMLTLKKINTTDAVHMIKRQTWSTGAVYDLYRHDYNKDNPAFSTATNLRDANYYVVNSLGDVYVCLDNNLNARSTVEPQLKNNTPFTTSDGYQWLLIYSILSSEMRDYSTTNYIPVYEMTSPRPAGELTTIVIDNPGVGYTNNPSGYPNGVTYYYVPITGNGTGAAARVLVNNGRVTEVDVVRGGEGYTYANMSFVRGNCYASLADLDLEANGLDPLGLETFRNTVLISPPGGWGYDVEGQLNASKVGIFSDLRYDLSDIIKDVTFRQTGILLNPESTGAETLSAVYAINLVITSGQEFVVGTEVEQVVTDGTAKGLVVACDHMNNILRIVQDPELHADEDGNLYHFGGSEEITGTAVGTPINFTGSLEDLNFVGGYAEPEITKYTGELIYLTNLRPVKREETQSERISFVIAF